MALSLLELVHVFLHLPFSWSLEEVHHLILDLCTGGIVIYLGPLLTVSQHARLTRASKLSRGCTHRRKNLWWSYILIMVFDKQLQRLGR